MFHVKQFLFKKGAENSAPFLGVTVYFIIS